MLAYQIAILRKKAGLSQWQMAKNLNVVPSTVGMYEQGRRTPSLELLIEMANLFEVSLDYLITGRESTHPITAEKDVELSPCCSCMACCCCCSKHAFVCHSKKAMHSNQGA